MICGPGSPRLPFPASARSGSGSPSPSKGARWGSSPLGLGKGCVPVARQLASASSGREGRPGCYRAVEWRVGGGGAPARGTGRRGARGPGSFHHGRISESAGVGGYNGLPAECGRQGGDAGGQGVAVSRTPEQRWREAEGGVPTSRPVPLLGKGAGRWEGGGEEKAAA